ncbi:hypothetical protein LTS18_014717, partial [Coniosporium uncinatum]
MQYSGPQASDLPTQDAAQQAQSAFTEPSTERSIDNSTSQFQHNFELGQKFVSNVALGDERSVVNDRAAAIVPNIVAPLPPVATSAAILVPGGSDIVNFAEEGPATSKAQVEECIRSGEACTADTASENELDLETDATPPLPQPDDPYQNSGSASEEPPATHSEGHEKMPLSPTKRNAQLATFIGGAEPPDDLTADEALEKSQHTQDVAEESWDVAPERTGALITEVKNDVTAVAGHKPSKTASDAITAAVSSKDKRKSYSKVPAKSQVVAQ